MILDCFTFLLTASFSTPTDGFGNHVESEAIPGTLPKLGNAPQKVAHGLYAEQISGTAFTAPRHKNQRSWLYRVRSTSSVSADEIE